MKQATEACGGLAVKNREKKCKKREAHSLSIKKEII